MDQGGTNSGFVGKLLLFIRLLLREDGTAVLSRVVGDRRNGGQYAGRDLRSRGVTSVDGYQPLVAKRCVFTDTKEHHGVPFFCQRWVITPMAGADHGARLLLGVF